MNFFSFFFRTYKPIAVIIIIFLILQLEKSQGASGQSSKQTLLETNSKI